ncbi:MAG TPA: hypothetical protein VN253_13650 [Kofleriaceae bacterium]|nr:hypothetical protein [Kofleriaceae bacterium]
MPTDAPAFCPWRTEAPLPAPSSYFAVAASGEHVYVLGGFRFDATTNQLVYDETVRHGKIGADGVIAAWTPEASFKTGRSGLGAVRLGKCLFVNGGSYSVNGTPVYADDTQSAPVAGDGKIGVWKTSPHRLKTPRSNHTLLGLERGQSRYLYAVAGVTQLGQDTVHLDTVEVAKVGEDCQIGEWVIANYHLRGGRSTPQALMVRDNLVVIGGWGDLDLIDVFDDVQVASARVDGTPGPWQVGLGRLPTGIYGHATSYHDPGRPGGPVLLGVGGQPGTGAYGTWISYAYVSTGPALPAAIGPWRIAPSGQLAVGRAGHGIVSYRDRLYVIGGSAPGGQFLKDVISSRFDTGEPLK